VAPCLGRRQTTFRDVAGALLARADIDWVLLDARGAPDPDPRRIRADLRRDRRVGGLARVALGDPATERRQVRIACGRTSSTRWTTSTTRCYARLARGSRHRGGDPAATRAIPRLMRLDYAAAADPGAQSRGACLAERHRLGIPPPRRIGPRPPPQPGSSALDPRANRV
jgi:hypothetical protein